MEELLRSLKWANIGLVFRANSSVLQNSSSLVELNSRMDFKWMALEKKRMTNEKST